MPYFIVLDPYQRYLQRVWGGGRKKRRNSEILNKPHLREITKASPCLILISSNEHWNLLFPMNFHSLKNQIFLIVWKGINAFFLQLLITRTGSWTEFCSPTFAIIVDKSKVLAILLEENWIDCLFKFTLFQLTVTGCYFLKRIVVWKCSAGL